MYYSTGLYHLLVFCNLWPPTQAATIAGVFLGHKRLGRPWVKAKRVGSTALIWVHIGQS